MMKIVLKPAKNTSLFLNNFCYSSKLASMFLIINAYLFYIASKLYSYNVKKEFLCR